jgi:hypothetical protein
MNNPFILKQTEHFADRVRSVATTPSSQIEAAFRLALQRAPSARETALLTGYLTDHGLVNLCRLILNTNEFLFVD